MAGMRAGADIGEPLTYKYIRALGLQFGTSTAPLSTTDLNSLLLNGVSPVERDLTSGAFRIVKCTTCYIKTQNNALMEESIIQGLGAVTKDLRKGLDTLTGTKATLGQISNIEDILKVILTQYGPEDEGGNGFLIRSIGDDGNALPPFRDIAVTIGVYPDPSDVARVSVTVTPVSGINFILNTIFAVPAQLSSSVI
jgi:hypothetical protein